MCVRVWDGLGVNVAENSRARLEGVQWRSDIEEAVVVEKRTGGV